MPAFILVGANFLLIGLLMSFMDGKDPLIAEKEDDEPILIIQSSDQNIPEERGLLERSSNPSMHYTTAMKWGIALFFFLNLALRGIIGVAEAFG